MVPTLRPNFTRLSASRPNAVVASVTAVPGRSVSRGVIVAWAVYLACSWTWCIGMYLPIVLRDEFGWPAVIFFAVPNLLGVMLFGVMMRTPERSRAFVKGHGLSTTWFSALIVLFHVFFLGNVWTIETGTSPVTALAVAPIVFGAAYLLKALSDRNLVRLALGIYAVSLVILVILAAQLIGSGFTLTRQARWPASTPGGAILLLPTLAIGFLMCPYFDRTFHRAFQAVAGPNEEAGRAHGSHRGRSVFIVFGFAFALMLMLTVVYSQTGLTTLVVVHIMIQSVFTMALHLKEIDVAANRNDPAIRRVRKNLFPLACIIWFFSTMPLIDYRDWFLFFGLVFPAVAVGTFVRRSLGIRQAWSSLSITAIIILLLPFDAAAFKGGYEVLALIPAAVLFLGPWFGTPLLKHEDHEQDGESGRAEKISGSHWRSIRQAALQPVNVQGQLSRRTVSSPGLAERALGPTVPPQEIIVSSISPAGSERAMRSERV